MAFTDLDLPANGDGSATVADWVATARAVQHARFEEMPQMRENADVEGEMLDQIAKPDADGRSLLNKAAERFGLSGRGYHRVLRVARTIADLDGSEVVLRQHVADAISFRLSTEMQDA
jgi:magnesium chelatase family protein